MATSKVPTSKDPVYKPYAIDLSEEEKATIEKWISDRLEQAIEGLSDRDTNIKEYRNVYAGNTYDREPAFEGGANVRIPIVGILTDAIHVRLTQSHFGVDPYVRIEPYDSVVNADLSRALENGLQQIFDKSGLLDVGFQVVLDALICGTGITKTTWYQDWKQVTEKGKKKYVLRDSYPKTEYIALEDFVTFPAVCRDLDSAMIVGHRLWRRWDEIQRGVATGLYNEDWVAEIETLATQSTETNDQDTRLGITRNSVDWKDIDYELFELIIGYDYDEDGLEEDYLVTFDRINKKIIRFMTYPVDFGERWYQLYTPIPLPNTIYGESMVRLIKDMDEEITTIYNQRLDNNTLVNMPQFKVMDSSRAAHDDEQARPGKKWIVSDMDEVQPLQQIPPLRDTSQEEQQLMMYAKQRSGVSDLNMGQSPSGERTAYEIEASLAEGSIKLRLFVLFGTRWLTRVAWHSLGLMKQFMESDRFERMTQYPFYLETMPWEEVWQELDIKPKGNTTTSNRELERQTMVFLRESFKNDPLLFDTDRMTGQTTPKAGWYEIAKDFILAHGKHDYKSIIGEPPQQGAREAIIQTPAEAQAQLASAGQTGGPALSGAANAPSEQQIPQAQGGYTPGGTA